MTAPFIATESESEWLWNALRLTHNRIPFLDLLQETEKHRLRIESTIVAETVLVQVGLQIVTANGMIDASNPGFDQRPKAFNRVRMNVAHHVDFLAMVDAAMVVFVDMPIHQVVRRKVVRKHCALRQNVLLNQSEQRRAFHVGSDDGTDAALAFNHSNDRRLGSVASQMTTCSALAPSAKVHFVHLYSAALLSAQRRGLLVVQHCANLLEHAPCGFVGHSSLALNLFRADAATSRSHQVDRMEPSCKRSGRLVKDRVSGRVNVMAAMVARVGWAARYAVMLCNRIARFAKDAVWVQVVLEPFQTGRVIRELLLEVFHRERQHFRFAVIVGHLITYSQVKSYQMAVPTVKG